MSDTNIVRCPLGTANIGPGVTAEAMQAASKRYPPSTVFIAGPDALNNHYVFNVDENMWHQVDAFLANSFLEQEQKSADSSRSTSELQGITHLGSKTTNYKYDYDPSILETFVNKHPDNDYVVSFDAYELTTLCPLTHQPDFAKIIISYVPGEKMVESKSLKLYLFSFRNHGDFHEDCINIIGKDLVKLMSPKYLEVRGIFSPRGGISIFPFFTYANPEYPKFAEFEKQRQLDVLRDSSNRTVRYDK